MRTRLHPWAVRHPGTCGDSLASVALFFRDNVRDASRVNRAFLKRMVVFGHLVMEGAQPEDAAGLAMREHPDPLS